MTSDAPRPLCAWADGPPRLAGRGGPPAAARGARLMLLRVGAVALLLAAAACARAPAGPVRQVQMAPVVVSSPPAPDAATLFELGAQALAREAYPEAIGHYRDLEQRFSGSALVPLAVYNRCLAEERRGAYAAALACQRGFIQAHPGASEFKSAHFRVAFLCGKLKRWSDVAQTFIQIRALPGLRAMDVLESHVGEGVGRFMEGDHLTAERAFRRALDYYAAERKLEYMPAEYWLGQSRFYLGEIYARAFEASPLEPPAAAEDWPTAMGQALETKCELLLRAQNNFIRAIRVGHTGWATASGFRIGALYERLYDEMMEVPVPPGLDAEAAEFYREGLKKRLGVLIKKAINVYERSLQMAERVGEDNEWVARTNASLERMRQLYTPTPSGA